MAAAADSRSDYTVDALSPRQDIHQLQYQNPADNAINQQLASRADLINIPIKPRFEVYFTLGQTRMKLVGYTHETEAKPLDLYAVSLSAEPSLLRELASFLAACAEEIEVRGSSWSHAHFTPSDDSLVKRGPEITVHNPKGGE